MTKNLTFYRVKHFDPVWLVELGKEIDSWRGKRRTWHGYITGDNGLTWEDADSGYMLHPYGDMKTIDVLLGTLIPYQRAKGFADAADRNRKRQEEYWEQQRELRERVESAIATGGR